MKKNYIWFTLVELIVTMTVLAILWTLSAAYIFDAFGTSRDSARITSIAQIVENMDLFKVNTWIYPSPDNSVTVTFSWSSLWEQWEFWPAVNQSLWVYWSRYPIDPRYDINYTYSVTNNNSEYQIGTILEDTEWSLDNGITAMIIPQARAAVSTAYVRGNYNGLLARAVIWEDHHFFTIPSIMANDLSNPDILHLIDNEKLVFDQFFNLPSTYQSSVDGYWGFGFFPSNPLVFSWAIAELQGKEQLTNLINEMKFVYASSQIARYESYQALIEGDTYTSTKKLLENVFWVPFAAHSCNDILANWEWLADGFYVVDIDEWEDGSVYCDMSTGDGWWTRVWIDYITNGEFQGGNPIPSEWGSNDNNTIVNLGVDNTPVLSEYAMRQTSESWWTNEAKSESSYQVHFDAPDLTALLQPGYEIRMTAWVRDDDGGSSWFGCNTPACSYNPHEWYIFRNTLFYIDGTNDVNGEIEVLDSVTTADGKQWELQRVRRKIRKTPTDFDWDIWHWAELNTDLYFTGVKLEIFYK